MQLPRMHLFDFVKTALQSQTIQFLRSSVNNGRRNSKEITIQKFNKLFYCSGMEA